MLPLALTRRVVSAVRLAGAQPGDMSGYRRDFSEPGRRATAEKRQNHGVDIGKRLRHVTRPGGLLADDGLAGLLAWRAARGLIRILLFRIFRLRATGFERLRADGPLIYAPVHRSHLDGPFIGGLTHHRVRYLGKEELFQPKAARLVHALDRHVSGAARRGRPGCDARSARPAERRRGDAGFP